MPYNQKKSWPTVHTLTMRHGLVYRLHSIPFVSHDNSYARQPYRRDTDILSG